MGKLWLCSFFVVVIDFVWVLTSMVGLGFANDNVGGVVSNFGGWAFTIWVFGGGS